MENVCSGSNSINGIIIIIIITLPVVSPFAFAHLCEMFNHSLFKCETKK